MRIILLILLLTSSIIKAQKKEKYEFILKGVVNFKEDRNIYFVWYNINEERFLDSTMVINGKFIYKGISNGYLNRFFIKSNPINTNNNDSLNNVKVSIDNTIMNIELKLGKFSVYKLTGSPSKDLLTLWEKKYKSFYDEHDRYTNILKDSNLNLNNKKKYEKLDSLIWIKLKTKVIEWCKKNPSNNLTPYYINNWSDYCEDEELRSLYQNINTFQKKSYYGLNLKRIIDFRIIQKNLIRKPFIDFEKMSSDSIIISLSKTARNNFVLLDFWASWCKPCRSSHPYLINLFKKYKSSNFKIISISVDENIADWRNAIRMDSLSLWTNVCTQKNDRQNLSKKYFVNEYPTKILINDKGIIISRYIGEKLGELEEKLKEIYKY